MARANRPATRVLIAGACVALLVCSASLESNPAPTAPYSPAGFEAVSNATALRDSTLFAQNSTVVPTPVVDSPLCAWDCPLAAGPNSTWDSAAVTNRPSSRNAPLAEPDSDDYHYWIGANYTGQSSSSTSIYTSITIPSSGPASGDTYFVLLSAWDAHGHYDQIGMSSEYNSADTNGTSEDVWEWDWSTTQQQNCNLLYTYDEVAGPLQVFTTHTFEMVLTGSHLEFEVFNGTDDVSGTPFYGVTVSDDAASFNISGTNRVCSEPYAGTTEYEESYYISSSQDFPQWNFNFIGPYYGSTLMTSWGTMKAGTPPTPAWSYYIYPAGSGTIKIANEPFAVYFAVDSASIAPGGWSNNSGSLNAIGSYCNTGNSECDPSYTSACSYPSGWTSLFGIPSDIPSSTLYDDFHAPSTAMGGMYYLGCTVSIPAGSAFDNYLFYVTVT
jgi:hypothetical protein